MHVAPGTPAGTTLSASVPTSTNIVARIGHSAGPFVNPLGSYPINSANFSVTAPAQNTIAAWRQRNFTEAQLQNSEVSDDLADANGNGVINLLEYAFNMDPIIDESGAALESGKGVPVGEVIELSNQSYFAIRYVRRRNAPDLTYTVLQSEALPNWRSQADEPALFQVVEEDEIDEEMEVISVRSTVPMSGNGSVPKQFVRVGVRLGP